jgi:hypothetical protein
MMSDAGRQKLDTVIARLRERINEIRGRKG